MDREQAYREELLARILDFIGAPDTARLGEAESDARWEEIRAEVWSKYFAGAPPPAPPRRPHVDRHQLPA